ncbi:MAG TPA: metallophosphoesterase, partial [Candidatus Paceibacterota bacterium]|nr:metallophosphoesterase [Candidatus Paceibacterota bacterium]
MKIIHFSDFHFDATTADRALASLAVVAETGEREKVSAFVLAGDLFNRGIQNSAAGRLPELLAAIGRLLDIAPVVAVSGTPTHDLPGCYDALTKLWGKEDHNFVMLQPGKAYYKDTFNDCIHDHFIEGQTDLMFLGLPEPSKSWLLAGSNGLSAEESAERVKTELRKILLGMGAIRAEHPEIPAVMLYHGAVEGATLANGQLLEGGIALGRDDLALVGADYYALGHVHLAQQIPGLPAYYSGSAFPVDWGEQDSKGCNLVTIDPSIIVAEAVPDRANVTRIPFPHAPRRKLVADWPHEIDLREAEGFQTWLVLKAPKGADCDSETWLAQMLADGALPGSRVTVELIPTETVRAAEITEQHHLRDKVRIYAEASDEAAPADTVLAKADALEMDSDERHALNGAHLRIRKLRLRGATGIWKGLGLDEVTLDLDAYDAGLVALVGPNGAGKSTLLENMHPWPCLLTREGKLQDHFRLRDSARELWFTDDRDGAEYRALMLVDGVNTTGKAEFHLFCGDTPLTNGRREDYEAAIERLFGSLALFLRSAFVSQRATKNNPDLAEATKGEKKAIFRELAGLDYLQAAAESAKGKGAAIESETALAEAGLAAKREALREIPELREKVEQNTVDLEAEEVELRGIEAEGKAASSKAKELAAALEQQRAAEKQITEENSAADAALAEAAKARAEIGTLTAAIEAKPAAEQQLAEYEHLREEERGESEKAKTHAEGVARIQSKYSSALRAHRDHEAEIQDRHSATQKAMVTLEGDRRVALAQIDRLIADIAVPEKACPQCGYIDPDRLTTREGWQTTLYAAQEKAHGLAQDIEEKHRALVAIEGERTDPPEAPKLPAFDNAHLLGLRGELLRIDVEALSKVLVRARTAEVRIAELTQIHVDRSAQAANAMSRVEKLRATLDGTLEARAEKAAADLEEARGKYVAASGVCASLRTSIKANQERIAELEKQRTEIEDVERFLVTRKAEAAEWQYLERACGADGIQALELDALGPGIAEVANRLLSAAYGQRFSIIFKTTRIAGRGSHVKQVEDFQVIITDADDGTEQELSTLSGGESVWIKNAVYGAFSIIRDRATGLRFLTRFIDEM